MKIEPNKVNLLEADIEQCLWENPNYVRFNGWTVKQWINRQFSVPSGIIDLVGQSQFGWIMAVEVKNVEVDSKAVAQVCRYAYDIDQILERLNGEHEPKYPYGCIKVLVGPSISTTVLRECEACDVYYVQFGVELRLDTSQLNWSDSFKEERSLAYDYLAADSNIREAFLRHQANRKAFDEIDAEVDAAQEEESMLAELDYKLHTELTPPDDEYSDIILSGPDLNGHSKDE